MGVAAENSLNASMDNAVKRYSLLFKLPSYRKAVTLLALFSVSGGLFPTIVLFSSFEGLVHGLLLGVSLFLINLILDYVMSKLILKEDPIYDLKRTTGLSVFCWGLWLFFIFIGVAVAMPFGLAWWVRLCLLGFSAVLILRLIVFSSTSFMSHKRHVAASALQPFLCIIPFLILWASMGYPITIYTFLFFIFSLTVGLAASSLLIVALNRLGEKLLGVPSMALFKAFLLNWIVDLNAPFEELLEKLSEEQNIEVSIVQFGTSKLKAAVVVPSVHPGPFKDIGSSILPSLLKNALETEFGCEACVPHGLLSHEFDLPSQLQNQKIIKDVIGSISFEASESKASPCVEVSNGLATACCQIFGKSVLISFTLAPKTIEDLPQELGTFVRQEAEKHGLICSVIVNAHNSLDGSVNDEETLKSLKDVAAKCLGEAADLAQSYFEVGAATISPQEFTLKDGMGAGGITVIVIKVGEQKTAYVTIDGNNMVSGLREKIRLALRSIGITGGEVFTTDTHSVSGVILGDRGYHPVGEAIDHQRLIDYVIKTTNAGLSGMERVKVACRGITVSGVKVIGEKRLETLCLLIEKSLQKAKKTIIPILGIAGLLLTLFLMFL